MDIIREDLVTLDDVISPAPHVSITMLRLDKVHNTISGNKWYKLKYNISDAMRQGFRALLTFGGAHSNHLLATAASAKHVGMKSIGIVRGFHGEAIETPTLQQCRILGMHLHFVSREQYAQKDDPDFISALSAAYPEAYIIPEGGANAAGRVGAGDIARHIPAEATDVCVSVGTGTTFTGLRMALPEHIMLHGFTAMKGGEYLLPEILTLLPESLHGSLVLHTGFHFGGFAKYPQTLASFADVFFAANNIPLDRVYNSKMMYGVMQMAEGHFTYGSKIVCVHTGGLR